MDTYPPESGLVHLLLNPPRITIPYQEAGWNGPCPTEQLFQDTKLWRDGCVMASPVLTKLVRLYWINASEFVRSPLINLYRPRRIAFDMFNQFCEMPLGKRCHRTPWPPFQKVPLQTTIDFPCPISSSLSFFLFKPSSGCNNLIFYFYSSHFHLFKPASKLLSVYLLFWCVL